MSGFYTSNEWKGKKYDRERPTKDVAKLIRRDIKAKYGNKVKASVRTEHFNNGNEIDIKIKDLAKNPINPDWEPHKQQGWGNIYTDDAEQLIDNIVKICKQYQWKEVGMIDYCDCNFYLSVTFDYTFQNEAIRKLGIEI